MDHRARRRIAAHLRAALSDLLPPSEGWAVTALQHSMRRVVLIAVTIWQPVMIGAALGDLGPGAPFALLAALHLGLIVLARLTERRRLPEFALVALLYAVCIVDYLLSSGPQGPLVFASCWLLNITAVATTLVVPGRGAIALALVGAGAVFAGVRLARPEWPFVVPLTFSFTCIAVLFVARLGLPLLLDFAARVDRESAAVERERLASAVAIAASREIAESSRVLHDTAVNTLGAIANGGAAVGDPAQVRLRCARDVAMIAELQAAQRRRGAGREPLSELFAHEALPIERSGLGDAELEELSRELPDDAVRALVRSTGELVLNAAKHSGAASVAIAALREGERFVVVIEDRGRGFDGRIPEGRGLANSVFGRCAEAGIDVEIDTAPGRGTRVTLSPGLATTAASAEPGARIDRHDVAADAARMQRSAGWVWTLGMVAVGVVIEAVNRSGEPAAAAYAMLVAVVLGSGLGWQLHERYGLRRIGATVFVVSAVLAFLLSAAAVDFGRADPFYWQVIGPTGPLIVLSTLRPGPRIMAFGYAAYAAAALALALAVLSTSRDAAAIVVIAGIAGVGLTAAWAAFQRTNSMIAERAVDDRQRALSLRIEREARAAADESHLRWLAAGLDESTALLRRIASGAAAPGDAAVRRACAMEEAYLRQLTQLSPEAVHLGRWATAALREGRLREVDLELRIGDADAPNAETARMLGETLLEAVGAMPRGGALRATVFGLDAGVQLTIVAPGGSMAPVAGRSGEARPGVSYRELGPQDLLEVTLAAPPAGPSVGAR